MTKEVLVSVNGLQTFAGDGDQADAVEIAAPGIYYYKNGCCYVFYEETQDGFEGVIKNRIRIREDFMEIRKEGLLRARMVFEKNKKTMTDYDTPFGRFRLVIETKSFELRETEDLIRLQVVYRMEINAQPAADCTVYLQIAAQSRDSE